MNGIASIVSAILLSCAAFVSTELDDFILILILLSRCSSKKQVVLASIGKYVALVLVASCSYFFAAYISKIAKEYIGFLGLILIGIGIVDLIKGSKEKKESDIGDRPADSNGQGVSILISSMLISLGSSGDNFAVYVPFFTSLDVSGFVVCGIVFLVLQFGMLILTAKAISVPGIQRVVDKVGGLLIPILLMLLGIYVLWANGTFGFLINLFGGR